jgi:tape measure domain-containing protein
MEGGDLQVTTIDERVVQMKFDNKAFLAQTEQTLKSLDSLNKALAMTGATKGLQDLNAAGQNVKLGHISEAIDGISKKFGALSIAGITALTNIANRAVDAGISLIKSLTVDPIKTGLAEYETNLNSIQTILANTGREGKKGLSEVTAALDELNHYSDQTIYNFAEMAKNIGTFTAAGVSLEVATEAIKGIANLAALSGSNAQQASAAMYQLSQAISAGKVSLEDWNSVVNAGMGGKVFQNALMETARVHGVAIDKMVKDAGSFRLTLQEGWLTGEILTETLSKFTGDLTAGQLKSMKYTDAQIEGILKMGRIATEAATKVKTMTQLIDTLQESATSGWSKSWQLIFGDFDQARDLFTNVNEVLGGFINASADARNKVLGDWAELGGRTSLIYSIKNAFEAVMSILVPIKQAFRQIFPATTGKDLYELTTAIRMFTEGLSVSGQTADKIHRIFAGLFAVFSIGWDIIKAVVSTIFDLGKSASAGSGGFLEFLATIGDWLVALKVAIDQGNAITKVFKKIGEILKVPIQLLQIFADWISKAFSKLTFAGTVDGITSVVAKLSPLSKLGDAILRGWQRIPAIFLEVLTNFSGFAAKVTTFFSQIGEGASNLTEKMDFTKIFAGAGTAGFVAMLVSIWNIVRKFGNAGGDFLEGFQDSLDALTGSLKAMQNTLKVAILVEIAAAVLLLAFAITQLSKVDAAGLTRSLAAITVMITQLFGAMAVFEKFMGVGDIAEMLAMGVALILLATALDILSHAVERLAGLGWNELAQGLTGVVVLLGALIVAMKFMPNPAGMISSAAGLVVLAVAIQLLVRSVETLSGLNWEELAKGLIGVGTLLGALILFTKFAGANGGGVLQGAGIVLLAVGIKLLVSAVKDFAEMSWMEIARGLTALGGALLGIGVALTLIPPTAPLAALGVAVLATGLGLIANAVQDMATMSWMEIARGMVVMAGALGVITGALLLIPPTAVITSLGIGNIAAGLLVLAEALKRMAEMSWDEIGRAAVVLVGALTVIALGMAAIQGAIAAAPALLLVATSLAILAPVLLLFGKMSWEEIGKGLLMLAGALTVIGLAGLILQPVIPSLIGLGVAITLLGVGMLAAGAGVLLLSIGLTALSVAGVAGTAALVGMVAALSGLIPVVLQNLGLGLVAFANVIATAAPAFTAAITAVLLAIILAIETLAPKVVSTFFKLLNMLLNALEDNMPVLQAKGLRILLSFLEGVADGIPKVIPVVAKIIRAYIDGVAKELPAIIQSGFNLIISFIEGLAKAVRSNSDRMSDAGLDLASAIVEGMVKGLAKGAGKVADAAKNMAKQAYEAAKRFLEINSPSKKFIPLGEGTAEGYVQGIDSQSKSVSDSAAGIGETAMDALKMSLSNMAALVSSDVDLAPTIRPILDLSSVRKSASELGDVLGTRPITTDGTYSRAQNASAGYQDNRSNDGEEGDAGGHSESWNFTQNNYSPKALSAADIYRDSKNLLSKAREVVTP